MKTLAMWKDKNKIGFSLGVNLLVLLGMLLWMRPGFGNEGQLLWTNMSSNLEGAVVYQNYLLRALYSGLQRTWRNVPWYALIQYVLLLSAFTAVIYVVLQLLDNRLGSIVSFLFLTLFGYECYIQMNHAKTAAILVGTGMLLLIYAAAKERFSKGTVLLGWIYGCIGAMCRVEQFVICGVLILGLCVYLLWEKRCSAPRLLGTMGILAVLVLGLFVADGKLYEKNVQWQQEREFYTVRDRLMDYGVLEYETNKELYKQLGIKKKTYNQLQKGKEEIFNEQSLETLQALSAAKPMERLSKALLLLYMRKFLVCCFRSGTFLCFLLLVFFWLFWGKKSKSAVLAALYEALMLGGMYFCLFYRMRDISHEYDMGLWFFLSLILIWFLNEREEKLQGSMWIVLCLSVLIASQKEWFTDWRIYVQKGQEKYYGAFDVTQERMENPPVIEKTEDD